LSHNPGQRQIKLPTGSVSRALGTPDPTLLDVADSQLIQTVTVLDLSKSQANEPIEGRALLGVSGLGSATLRAVIEIWCLSPGGIVIQDVRATISDATPLVPLQWFVGIDDDSPVTPPILLDNEWNSFNDGQGILHFPDVKGSAPGGLSIGSRAIRSHWMSYRTGGTFTSNHVQLLAFEPLQEQLAETRFYVGPGRFFRVWGEIDPGSIALQCSFREMQGVGPGAS